MINEVLLFSFRAQALLVPLKSRKAEQGFLSGAHILVDKDLVQQNLGYLFVLDASNGVMLGPILPYFGLVISLTAVSPNNSLAE